MQNVELVWVWHGVTDKLPGVPSMSYVCVCAMPAVYYDAAQLGEPGPVTEPVPALTMQTDGLVAAVFIARVTRCDYYSDGLYRFMGYIYGCRTVGQWG